MAKNKVLLVSLGVSAALMGICGAVYALTSRYRCQKPISVRTRTVEPVKVFKKETWGAD